MNMKQLLKQRELLLFVIIAIMIGLFSLRAPGFASPGNLANIFNDTSILIILALGQMSVILTKSIDLSVATNLAFTGMAVAMLNATFPDIPLFFLVIAAIGIGAALGAINGILVWKLDIPAIVVTLGTLTIYRGMAFVLSGGMGECSSDDGTVSEYAAHDFPRPASAWLDGYYNCCAGLCAVNAQFLRSRALCLRRQSHSSSLCRN